MQREPTDSLKARSNCWSHIEEVFLVGSVLTRWWTKGSLARERNGEERADSCWDEIKKIYDKNWKNYKKGNAPTDRTTNALSRHFKVMKTRISESHQEGKGPPDSFQNYYLEWELVYNRESSELYRAVQKVFQNSQLSSVATAKLPSTPTYRTRNKDRSFSESVICEENKQESFNPELRRKLYELISSDADLDSALGPPVQNLKPHASFEDGSKHLRKRVYSSTTDPVEPSHHEYYNTVAGANGAEMAAQLRHELNSFGRHPKQYHVSERFKYSLGTKKAASRQPDAIQEHKVLVHEPEPERIDETHYVSELFGIFGIDGEGRNQQQEQRREHEQRQQPEGLHPMMTQDAPHAQHQANGFSEEEDKLYYNTVSGADAAKMAAQLRYEQEHNKRHVAVEVNRTYESMETKRRLLHRARTVQEMPRPAYHGVHYGGPDVKQNFQNPFTFGRQSNANDTPQSNIGGGHGQEQHVQHESVQGQNQHHNQDPNKTFHRDMLDSDSRKQQMTAPQRAPVKTFFNHTKHLHLPFFRRLAPGSHVKDKGRQHQQDHSVASQAHGKSEDHGHGQQQH